MLWILQATFEFLQSYFTVSLSLPDSWMSPQQPCGDVWRFPSASCRFPFYRHCVEFFPSVELRNGHMVWNMSPEPPST